MEEQALTNEQHGSIIAALKVVNNAIARFALAGSIDAIDQDAVQALKQALIIPLAVLHTTDEEYHEMYQKAHEADEAANELANLLRVMRAAAAAVAE